jgi:hypothetical protein
VITTSPFAVFTITYRYKREGREYTETVRDTNARAALAQFVENHTNDEDSIVFVRIAGN